jgi:hypothetical protein
MLSQSRHWMEVSDEFHVPVALPQRNERLPLFNEIQRENIPCLCNIILSR